MSEKQKNITRRKFVKITGVGGAAGLAGCLGGGDGGDGGGDGGDGGDGGGDGGGGGMSPGKPLKIQHWWTSGGEKAAITALLDGFKNKYSGAKIEENPVPGGGGVNLKQKVTNQILSGNPPSTWQNWPGKALTEFINGDVLKDIESSVWDKNNMKEAYLDGVKTAAKGGDPNGNYYAVPINIHRLNNLFYNKSVVDKAGVDPSNISSPSDLLDVMKQIEDSTDAAGMGHALKTWTTLQLWAQVLLGEYGVDTYMGFANGKVEENSDAVKGALQTVKEYREYFNKDASSVKWSEANAKVVSGDAAFIHQGDWAAGDFINKEGFDFGDGWGHVPFPGTEGKYALNMDSFPYPKNNPSPDTTTLFLRYCGTKDAQIKFNKKKGSIPPRTDVSSDEFGPFLSSQMKDFSNSSDQPPSMAHGLALAPEKKSNVEGAISSFIENWNVDKTYNKLVNAF